MNAQVSSIRYSSERLPPLYLHFWVRERDTCFCVSGACGVTMSDGLYKGCPTPFFRANRKVLAKAQFVSGDLSESRANSLTPRAGVITTFTTAIIMPSVSHAIGNLYHSVAEILGGLLNSILAVFQSIFALAINTVGAFFAILRVLFTSIVDLMSGAVGFVIGASAVQSWSFSFTTHHLFAVCLQATSSSLLFLVLLTGSSRRRGSEDG
jgi:hypothetical protein